MPERPADLTYALDEKPPWPQLLALGFQHVAVICPYLVMVALVTEAAKLPRTAAQSAIGLAMIAIAMMTVLQSLRWKWVGSGYLCPPVVSAIYLPSCIAAATSFGFSAVCGMVVFAGVCEVAVAFLVNRTRKLFPAVVSGVVIVAVGLELGKIGSGLLLQHVSAHPAQSGPSFVTAACSLATMAGLAIWATGLPKLFCSLIGILVGYAAAAVFHVFPSGFAADYFAARFFAIPSLSFLAYRFAPSFAMPFAIAGLASGLRAIGVLTTCQQMNDAAWRHPDMANIGAGVRADGLGCLFGGLLGVPGMSASPSLVGVEKTTGATSRVIAWSIAGWLVLLSCLPKFAGLIINMPRPVMAAALVFNGALMLVAGIQIIASRPITLRATLTVGFSILASLTVPIFPEFYNFLPAWTHQFTGSIISMAVVVAVPLNALFLLDAWHYKLLRLGDDGAPVTPGSFDIFFKKQAREWKIPAEDAERIRSVVDTAIEYVTASANGPVDLQIGSDDFDIVVTLRYMGNLPSLPDASPKTVMVEEQSFVNGLTGYLSGLHADRVERSAKGEQCEIKLLFRL
ncbi:MAG TPA: solute carrier family 23 protein [Acidobacteriaceae bacterium]|nr:solute carrier family 23 protein [Acidobacteriaceae bacterium]